MYGSKETPEDVIRDLAKVHFNILDLEEGKVLQLKSEADYQWVASVMKGLENSVVCENLNDSI